MVDAPEHEDRSGQDGAAVAGGDHAGALAARHQIEADADGAVLLLAQRLAGRLVHLDGLACVADAQLRPARAQAAQLGFQARLVAHQ